MKVGACKDVNPLIKKKNHGRGGGGFPGNQKTPLDTPLLTDTDSVTETDSVGDWRGRGWESVGVFDGFHLARLN